mmetsp:Transcript_10575/g.31348  ORF Transcript_10575/g.31348 Transcript_10575/m.31348 type:complete len:316 (-) Transcript_10575:89-1036(-)
MSDLPQAWLSSVDRGEGACSRAAFLAAAITSRGESAPTARAGPKARVAASRRASRSRGPPLAPRAGNNHCAALAWRDRGDRATARPSSASSGTAAAEGASRSAVAVAEAAARPESVPSSSPPSISWSKASMRAAVAGSSGVPVSSERVLAPSSTSSAVYVAPRAPPAATAPTGAPLRRRAASDACASEARFMSSSRLASSSSSTSGASRGRASEKYLSAKASRPRVRYSLRAACAEVEVHQAETTWSKGSVVAKAARARARRRARGENWSARSRRSPTEGRRCPLSLAQSTMRRESGAGLGACRISLMAFLRYSP